MSGKLGNCASLTAVDADRVLSSKATAVQLCADCPLQYACIAMLTQAHDRNSCMGGLNYEERLIVLRLALEDLQVQEIAPARFERWLGEHPHVLAQARDEYRRVQREKRNSLRRRQYTREYMSGFRTLSKLADRPTRAMYY